MPEYRIRETGEVVINLAAQFPNTSLPVALSQEDFDALGIDPVLEGPQPHPTMFQTAYRDGIEKIGDKWFTKYAVSDMEQEAIDALTERQWQSIRQQRNTALSQCDWTQLSDTSADAASWAIYRQALRDITQQENPFDIVWPEVPA